MGKSIEAQKAKIEALRNKQSQIKGSTEEAAAAYLKYDKQIDSATAQLKSMEQQQSKARQQMDYQKSGLAGLQSEYKSITTVSNSYVERLKAEGKSQQANREQMKAYQSGIENLNKQLKLQESELAKVATESGKNSSAYRLQQTRVNETATAIAKARNSMDDLNDEMKKANPSIFSRIKTAISGVNDKAEKTHSIFKSVFSANLISSAVQNVWGHLSSWIGSATSSAKEYSLAQQTMNATWTTLTGNAKNGQAMVDMTNSMAIAANNATDMVDGMNQKFYAISKNADVTKTLTQSVLTLQDAFGQSDAAVENFSTQFAQMMANGKVGAQDMMSFVNTFPVLRTNLLKTEQQITGNHNLSMKQMNDLMSQGKISSETMEKVLQDTATQYGAATENFGKTIPGMIRTVKSQMPVLLSAISDPLTKAANPIIGTMSKWVTSSETKTKFTEIGKTFSAGLNKVIEAFGGGGDGSGMVNALNKGLETLQTTISGVFSYLAKHAKDIKGIASDTFEIVKLIASGAWDVFKSTLTVIGDALGVTGKNGNKAKDPLKTIHGILEWMVDRKDGVKAFGGILAGLWMTSKVVSFGKAIGGVYSALKGLGDTKLGGMIASNLGKLDLGSKLGGLAKGAGKIAIPVALAYDAVSGITALTKAFGKGGSTGQKFKAVGQAAGTLIGGGIGAFFGGPAGAAIGATVGKVVGTWAGDAPHKFSKGWDSKKRPKNDWLAGLGWDAKQMTGKIGTFFSDVGKKMDAGTKNMKRLGGAATDYIGEKWSGFWGSAKEGWGSTMSAVSTYVGDKMSSAKTAAGNGVSWISSKFSKGFGGIASATSKAFGGIVDAISHPIETAKGVVSRGV